MVRVLLADDDAQVRKTLCRFLERNGCWVDTVGNGVDALRRIEQERYDVVVTDIFMEGMDGVELILRLATRPGGPKVVAISGGFHSDPDFVLDTADALGAVKTLVKPVGPGQLVDAVQVALIP